MTSPVVIGYPDWARRTPMADQNLINATVPLAPALTTYGGFYVANLEALWLHFTAGIDAFRVLVSWYMDAALTQLIGSSRLDFRVNTLGNRTFRPLAPYMRVTVEAAVGGVGTFTLILNTTSDIKVPFLTQSYINPISRYLFNIPATSIVVQTSQIMFIGPAVWSVDCTASIWEARLQTVDYLGNISEIDRCAKGKGDMLSRPIWIGGGIPQISIQNFDAAAQSGFAYLNQASDAGY